KSHSAAYALIAYQTAYLKANHPVQFMAAVLTAELGNAEKVSHFIAEAEAMGITVLGPDVNESRDNFTPVGDKIRFGLAGIKGVGDSAAQKIIAGREAGPYTGFDDFIIRSDSRAINKRVLENLVATGAFDFAGTGREDIYPKIDAALAALAELQRMHPGLRKESENKKAAEPDPGAMLFDLGTFDSLPPPPPLERLRKDFHAILRHSKIAALDNTPGQAAASDESLDFGAALAAPAARQAAAPAGKAAAATRVFNAATRLQFEKELLGFYVSGHPLNTYAGLTEALDTCDLAQIITLGDRMEFRVCGIASGIQKKLSKKPNKDGEHPPWAPFVLSTKTASIPMNMYATTYAAYGASLTENALVVALGNVITGQEGPRVNLRELYPLEHYVPGAVKKIRWLLRPDHPGAPDFLRALRAAIDKSPGDTRADIAFLFEDRVATISEAAPALAWKLNPDTYHALRRHPAVAGIQIEVRPLELKQERRWGRKN
ncbi:MAG: hypothetical protein LBM92_01510, partial [Opitutaceae bacterium]|nr:hypothetical protein [Opitutaceae bacterium]